MTDFAAWLEQVWAHREEVVYPRLFGALESSIAPLSAELFRDMFGQAAIDPRWLHVGVMVAPPTPERASWLYVTSGLSNPWEMQPGAPASRSGLGREFVFECPVRADWPVLRLQHVAAFELLIAAGRYPGCEPLSLYDRLPLRGPLPLAGTSALRWLLVASGAGFPSHVELASGGVDLLSLVAITDDEAALARERGGEVLLARLRATGAFPVSDPERASVLLPE
jgi:hypothetical protein